jgi:hypothetical protein
MESEWEKEKEKILNSLLGAGQESLDFPSEPEVCVTTEKGQIILHNLSN